MHLNQTPDLLSKVDIYSFKFLANGSRWASRLLLLSDMCILIRHDVLMLRTPVHIDTIPAMATKIMSTLETLPGAFLTDRQILSEFGRETSLIFQYFAST